MTVKVSLKLAMFQYLRLFVKQLMKNRNEKIDNRYKPPILENKS